MTLFVGTDCKSALSGKLTLFVDTDCKFALSRIMCFLFFLRGCTTVTAVVRSSCYFS